MKSLKAISCFLLGHRGKKETQPDSTHQCINITLCTGCGEVLEISYGKETTGADL